MSQPRRSPRLAGLAAQRNARDVTISLDDDDTDSIQSTAHCEACHEEAPRSSLVRIPCCDYLAHPTCVDAMCPFCEIDLRDTLVHTGELRCPECGDHVHPDATGDLHSACSLVAPSFHTTWNVSPAFQWRTMVQFSAHVARQVAVTMLTLVGSNVCVASMVWIGPRRRMNDCVLCADLGR